MPLGQYGSHPFRSGATHEIIQPEERACTRHSRRPGWAGRPTRAESYGSVFPALSWCRFPSGGGALKGQVQDQHGDWKRLLVRFGGHRRLFPNSASYGGSATGVCISRIVTPRDRSLFIAGKMDADRANAREIPYARHDFPQCRRGIQLLMANPSSCAGLKRNSAENPAPYRMIPHAWAFRPS